MALIELKNVERHYRLGDNDVAALAGVSLTIEAGEYVAIVGQSGSGKSTLMNVLGCLDKPTTGSYTIAGRDTAALEPDELAALRREHFGFIFQRYHLLGHLDARANAALPAVYTGQGTGKRLERARQLLERLGLAERLHHKPNELSGGQQQRVSIARALMNGGQIILADEPTGALDSASGAEMLRLLSELNASGHTVIIVTHDHSVAAQARRVITMKDGHVLSDAGTPAGHLPRQPEPPPASQINRLQRSFVQWREAVQTAWSALKGSRLRTALSMLGISIGIASVVSIVALTSAARQSFESDLASFISGRISVWRGNAILPPGAQPKAFQPAEIEGLRALPGVVGVNLEREAQMTVRQGSRDALMTVRSGGPQTLTARKLRVAEGRYFNTLDLRDSAQVVVIDQKARENLFKKGESPIGRTLMLTLGGMPDPAAQAAGVQAPAWATLPMTVVGVVESDAALLSGGNWLGEVFLPDSTFTRKVDARADYDHFDLLISPKTPPEQVREQMTHRLRALHGAEDFSIWSGEEEFRKVTRITAGLAGVFAGVAAIALVVGGVGVMNIMLVSVSERTREIGIRMAVGARRSDVLLQFLVEAVVLCCLGGLVGVALSWLAAFGFNQVQQQLHVSVSWDALVVAFAVSSGVGLIFGTLPARRAAALSPVDALARE
ncbi:ATP-binding cassette domain-containing protein [Paucibacter sp. R3-3]|uniref:ATP-binding cassette domain-containing protein n=1 Tax=Roseateles agri TaxID=3098619 RepID=A0ABU5DGA0_9BURK|nr:ATP-binding cassette domain-containing protein [Paucibacter sp. R3-3]MDY0745313.1 ATP-binding cassette domain-containing protein [Paucibacter sp. R3-3]